MGCVSSVGASPSSAKKSPKVQFHFAQGDRVQVISRTRHLVEQGARGTRRNNPLAPSSTRRKSTNDGAADEGWIVLDISEGDTCGYAVQLVNGEYLPSVPPTDLILICSQELDIAAFPRVSSLLPPPQSSSEDSASVEQPVLHIGATVLVTTPTGRYSGIVAFVNKGSSGQPTTYCIQTDFGEYLKSMPYESLERFCLP